MCFHLQIGFGLWTSEKSKCKICFQRTKTRKSFWFAVHRQSGGGSPWQSNGDRRCNEENQSKTIKYVIKRRLKSADSICSIKKPTPSVFSAAPFSLELFFFPYKSPVRGIRKIQWVVRSAVNHQTSLLVRQMRPLLWLACGCSITNAERRGFNCSSAFRSNLTTKLLCQSEVSYIPADTLQTLNPGPWSSMQENSLFIRDLARVDYCFFLEIFILWKTKMDSNCFWSNVYCLHLLL